MLTLTQQNTSGETVATVVLNDVILSSWELGSSTAQAAPTESLNVAAGKVCITDAPSGNKFCYNVADGKVF